MSSTFRKQFQRVRQNIDQNLGRAEKSEVLNEEEQNLERRVELLKNICTNLFKKLQYCLRNAGQGTDPEKRMKKIPESSLSHTLIECSVQFEQHTPSGQIFLTCGDAEGRLAQEILQMEVEIENKVLKTVQTLLEIDFPLIQKLKKQLNTRTLDMDASKARYASATKQAQTGATLQTKVDDVRNELEDNMSKVDQTKDQLSTEMYNFVSKEIELNQSLLDLVNIQASYHRQSLTTLEKLIPIMQESIDFASIKPVFSQRLEEHLNLRASRQIAVVIEECVSTLVEYGLEEEGLFRIAGSSSKIKKLKAAFNSNISCGPVITSNDEDIDVHVVASILKLYLRELPEPLLCSNLYPDWMLCLKETNEDKKVAMLKEVIQKMPKVYQINTRYVIRFLAKLAEYSETNKMTPSNIGLVMGPNLLWPQGDQGPNMLTTGMLSNLAENLIHYALVLFPGDVDFSYGMGMLRRQSHHSHDISSALEYTILPAIIAPDLSAPTKTNISTKDLSSTESTSETTQSNTLKKSSSKKHPAPSPPTLVQSVPVSLHTENPEAQLNKLTNSSNIVLPTNIKPTIDNNRSSIQVQQSREIHSTSTVNNNKQTSENRNNLPAKDHEIRTSFTNNSDSLDVVVPYPQKTIEKPRIAPPERPNLPPPKKKKVPTATLR